MILHPAILSIIASSALIGAMTLFAAWKGFMIILRWDLKSGTDLQLRMERETYLISTLLTAVFVFQILSLFLYIFTADYLHPLLVGAMCAAGTLNANGFGYPVLLLKIFTCIAAGVWLIINHMDSKGYDYPLIRVKYAALIAIIPFIITETVLQFRYFADLRAEVITSCCGSLFSSASGTLSADLASLPRVPMALAFIGSIVVTVFAGIFFRSRGKGGNMFAAAGAATFVIAVASLVAFVSPYVYELPTHHCPFCILHREYGHIGYPLYASLLVAVICSIGVGVLGPAGKLPSLAKSVPGSQQLLVAVSTVLYLLFGLAVAWLVASSNLKY